MLKECKKHGLTEHFIAKDRKWIIHKCKRCNCEKVMRRHRKLKLLLIEYAGGKCITCGYNKCPAALHFHHRNPKEKLFGIAQKMYSMQLELLKKEVDKCDLLCANCHAEIRGVEYFVA